MKEDAFNGARNRTGLYGRVSWDKKAGPDQSIDPWRRVVVIQITMVPIHVIPNVLELWDVAFKI